MVNLYNWHYGIRRESSTFARVAEGVDGDVTVDKKNTRCVVCSMCMA